MSPILLIFRNSTHPNLLDFGKKHAMELNKSNCRNYVPLEFQEFEELGPVGNCSSINALGKGENPTPSVVSVKELLHAPPYQQV
jgi:hypothetical protein